MKHDNPKLALQLAVLAVSMGLAGGAQAATAYEEALVLSSTPIYRSVANRSPSRECWQEEVVRQDYRGSNSRNSVTPNILGAVIGGALGNAVGSKKRNKQVGTVVGAILGGSIGSDVGRSNRSRYDDNYGYGNEYVDVVQRWRTVQNVYHEERVIGYDVRYSYNGTEGMTRMSYDPGQTVRVRVNVVPVPY